MRVNSLKELEQELMKKINTALDTDVADAVRDVMTDHIIQDVYDAYEPSRYKRRKNNGGLLDPENIISTIDGNGGLSVQNITTGSKYYYNTDVDAWLVSANYNEPIVGVIETGKGYDVYQHDWSYLDKPRPFMKKTHDDLKFNHYHTQAIKNSLIKQGLEVK